MKNLNKKKLSVILACALVVTTGAAAIIFTSLNGQKKTEVPSAKDTGSVKLSTLEEYTRAEDTKKVAIVTDTAEDQADINKETTKAADTNKAAPAETKATAEQSPAETAYEITKSDKKPAETKPAVSKEQAAKPPETERPETAVPKPDGEKPKETAPLETGKPETVSPETTPPETAPPETEKPAETEPPKPQRNEPPAMDFTAYDLNGNAVKLSDYIGKPIVLNFWASWCAPCKHEMPAFNEKYLELGDEVHFLMVNVTAYDTPEAAKALLTENGYSFPVLLDVNNDGVSTYGITGFPTTYFIDAEGYLIGYARGAISAATLQEGIDMIT